MKNIVLTGFMGTGKTVVGDELAKRLGRKLIDMDNEIEKSEGLMINEIFSRFGEPRFRKLETAMAKKLSPLRNVIISTGGGVVLKEENMRYLRKNGIIVCLVASPETILRRTMKTNDRPLLNVDDPLRKITDLLEYRMPFYENADIIIDTEKKNPFEITGEIIEMIKVKYA